MIFISAFLFLTLTGILSGCSGFSPAKIPVSPLGMKIAALFSGENQQTTQSQTSQVFETSPPSSKQVWIMEDTPVWNSPVANSEPRGIIQTGTVLKGYSFNNGWYFFSDSTGWGWIEEKYVSTVPPPMPSTKNKTYKLTIQAKPEDSTIRIMNMGREYRPGINLKPGRYDILVEREGYKTVRQWVAIQDADVAIPFTLQSLTPPLPDPMAQKDTAPPQITIREPTLPPGTTRLTRNRSQLTVRGHVADASGIFSVMVNGEEATVSPQGEFWTQVRLLYGDNSIRIRAMDQYNNVEERVFTVVRGATPSPPSVARPFRRRFALVIGNSSYDVGRLQNPANDAIDISEMLRELGFSVTLIRDATQQDMEDAIDIFTRKLGEGDAGLFFFAGHGVQVNGQNYLIPIDAQISKETDVKYQAVSANWILDNMEYAGNALNIVILDACRDNPYARSWRSSQQGLAGVPAVDGALIAYATAPGKTAAEGTGRNSPYTKHLLRFMPQPNMKVEELFKQVRIAVRRETKDNQTPWESSSLIGDFYFTENTP